MVPSNATPWQSTWRGIFLVGNSFAKMDPQMWVNVLKGTCYTLYIYSIYFFYYTIIVLIGGTNNIQCIVKYSGYNYISSCWFQTFFIFPYIWNSNPNWLSYFSEGLKPPTRYIYIYILYIYCINMYPWWATLIQSSRHPWARPLIWNCRPLVPHGHAVSRAGLQRL